MRLTAALFTIASAAGVPAASKAADDAKSVASHIPGSASAVRPVTVIDCTDIERSGVSNLHDLLASRSAYNSFGLYRPSIGGAVFLIDGRRIPSPSATYVLEFLPVSAVERVEILSGGAVALHSGDVIGGAVNIVLRRDFEGTEARTGGEIPGRKGGRTGNLGALWEARSDAAI